MSKKRAFFILCAMFTGFFLMSTQAHALQAVTFSSSGDLPINSTESAGWEFTVTSSISVVDLGLYDGQEGGLVISHQVGIWNSSGTLLVSGTVAPGDPLVNQFRYTPVAPTILAPGTYDIGASYGLLDGIPDPDGYVANTSNFLTAPEIKFVQAEFTAPISAGLTDPKEISASFFSNGMFGPNFEFNSDTAVPEPSTMLLYGLGLIGIAAYGLKFKKP